MCVCVCMRVRWGVGGYYGDIRVGVHFRVREVNRRCEKHHLARNVTRASERKQVDDGRSGKGRGFRRNDGESRTLDCVTNESCNKRFAANLYLIADRIVLSPLNSRERERGGEEEDSRRSVPFINGIRDWNGLTARFRSLSVAAAAARKRHERSPVRVVRDKIPSGERRDESPAAIKIARLAWQRN